jgi:ABC-type dipeptide/oligopeptide/nickel transport system permease component
VRTARAKGISEYWVVIRHALRNALVPVVTILGLQLGRLLGGAVVTETVFSWPGVGRLIIDSISYRDYAVVQGTLLLFVIAFMLVNLLTDLSYALLDPHIRLGGAAT